MFVQPLIEEAGVRLRNVEAGYPRRPVLRQLTARLPESAVTAVVGPNGSGKSTLLGVVAGVLPHSSGVVTRGGLVRPGLVVQRSAVPDSLPLTVRGAVTMGRWARRGPWRRLTRHDRSVVEHSMERLGIRDLARRQLGELSGGQRQRAFVAQGLAQEPDLFLLDEPTTGLDARAKDAILAVLAEAAADGAAVVQATHDMAAAGSADHCLVLQQGRLVAEGAPRDVLTDDRLRQVWGLPEAA
ncbi:zinc ABC transporter ATP-binding protein AztA [Streptomyces xiaopingdaonensis]|uniref:zinc ABC transporter ATP-binding protein AztA n=1 Tax=Streptomyces xiaopingdaonensis TaxID=1565415 RepID=UPI00037CAF1C